MHKFCLPYNYFVVLLFEILSCLKALPVAGELAVGQISTVSKVIFQFSMGYVIIKPSQ